jgi:hypothetical protein
VHAQIEEEIFYPAVGEALEDDGLVNEAIEEHDEMKKKIAEIVESTAADKTVDGAVKQLMRIVEHHVQEEQTHMFPDIRQVDVNLMDLGRRLAARRAETLLRMLPGSAATLEIEDQLWPSSTNFGYHGQIGAEVNRDEGPSPPERGRQL